MQELELNKIYDAKNVLEKIARKTDLIHSAFLSKKNNVYLKCENLQLTGSFKLRGAYYKIAKLTDEEKKKGVIACSAGNHAQGVALAAKENNIKIAIENMWQCYPNRKIWHSTCSKPEEFIKYIDTLDSKWIVGCLDIGHCALVCEEPDLFIEKLGHRLKALHVHDVDGFNDSHTIPYFGVVQWDKVTKALAKIGYTGDFTFETDTFINNPPKELVPIASKMLAETGRYLIEQIK